MGFLKNPKNMTYFATSENVECSLGVFQQNNHLSKFVSRFHFSDK